MTTKRKSAPEPDREVGIPEEQGPVRQEPTPYPPGPDPGEHVGPSDPVSDEMRAASEAAATPMPITNTEKAPPPPLPIAGPDGTVLSASTGLGRFHQIVSTGDVEALKAIATAAHDVAQAGGLTTTDRRVSRLNAALMAALYNA